MCTDIGTNTLTHNVDPALTFTPSAFLLLPLFPPERGIRIKRQRSTRVRKKGTNAEKKSDGITLTAAAFEHPANLRE